MKFFKKRSVIVILCWALIIVSTLLNVRIRFGGKCREVTDQFYSEAEIARQLEQICFDAMTLSSVAEEYGVDASALRTEADSMLNALGQSYGASYVHRIYEDLYSELTAVEQKLLGVALSESHAASVSACLERIHSAQYSISSSGYNETVRSFRRRYDRFPTSILARLAGIKIPEVFA